MAEVFIGAGSNADPERRLRLALGEIEKRFGALRCSRVYRTAAAGAPADDYLNLVVAPRAGGADPDLVREALRDVEVLAGRTRSDPAVCELDLDLLLHGARVDAPRRLPRPGLLALPYVLVPLAELAPDLKHPVSGERYGAAASNLPRGSVVDLGLLRR